MNEIYWITRLDGINTFLFVLVTLGVIALALFIIGLWAKEYLKPYIDEYVDDDEYVVACMMTKFSKPFVIAGVVATLLLIFIPTTKEALLIYGVGGAIDYVQSNETIKKLPDKAVEALDKYLDELNYERDKNSNTTQ